MPEEWLEHFNSSIALRNKQIDSIRNLMSVYEILRQRDLKNRHVLSGHRVPGSASSTDDRLGSIEEQTRRLDKAVQQKSKQIESQQALLSDLQAQLSAKEIEVRDLQTQLSTVKGQATALKAQVDSMQLTLENKEFEIIKLRNDLKAVESADKIQIIEELNNLEITQNPSSSAIRSNLPRKVTLTHQLSKAHVPPNFITTTGGTSGPQIVAVCTRRLHCFNAASGNVITELDIVGASSSASLTSASISAANDLVLVGTSEAQLSLVDIGSGGRVLKDLKGHSGKIKGCGFLGSRSKGFSVSTDRTIKIWDLSRASPLRSVPVTSQLVGGVATLDGTMFVTGHLNGKVTIWSQHDKICEVEAHTDSCLGVSISPDGRFITSIGKDDTCAIIDIHMAQSGPLHKLKGFKALSTDAPPSVSMDSKILTVCANGGLYSWDLFVGSPIGSIATDAVCLSWSAGNFSPEGMTQQVITAHENGTVKWWSP